MSSDPPFLRVEPDADATLAPALVLPPNFRPAVERGGKAVVKLEMRIGDPARGNGEGGSAPRNVPPERPDRSVPYRLSDGGARILWLLRSWCGRWPGSILQLSVEQLVELQNAADGEPLFFRQGETDALPADAEELRSLASAAAKAAPPKSTAPRRPAKPAPGNRPAPPTGTPGTIDGSEHFLAIGLPSEEHPAYGAVRAAVKAERFRLEPSNRKWWLRDRDRVLDFLAEYGRTLENDWGLQPTANFRQRTAKIVPLDPVVRIEANAGNDESYAARIDWQGVPEAEVRDAARRGARRIEKDGRIYLVSPEDAEKAGELGRKLRACGEEGTDGVRLRPETLSTVEDWLEEWEGETVSPAAWKESLRRLRDPDAVELPELPPGLDHRLRPYQRLGAAWFRNLHRAGLGGILADEMGLGKTVQSLALLGSLAGSDRPSLVVCPASLVANWVREAAEFTPGLRAQAYHGQRRDLDFGRLAGDDLVVTSYGTLRADRALFLKARFNAIIADEAQNFKNPATETARVIRRLEARSRFALTGTPIENSVTDLEGIGRFALPGVFGSDHRSGPSPAAEVLAKAKPYLLRRTKAEVLADLPEKWETRRFVALAPAQEKLYREIRARTEQKLFRLRATGAGSPKLTAELWTELLRLRQVTAEPRILDPDLPRESSSKAEGLLELIAEARNGGSRLLVFSQFTQTLRWLREDLEAEGIPFSYLDGATRDRQERVDRFNGDPGIPVFLLSLKAGGTGLNLTGADTVVHYDPWWNPAVEAQATDRAHRIGQTRRVQSIQLLGAGTVEEKVVRLQEEKRALLGSLFEGANPGAALDWDTIADLVGKKGSNAKS